MTSLSSVERSVLIALMAAGKPLRESADLIEKLQIGMKASHRKKLQDLGLIETSSAPLTHSLTDAGSAMQTDLFGPLTEPPKNVDQADLSLAIALQDIPTFSARKARLQQSGAEIEQLALAAEGVFQHIRMAAKKRRLEVLYEREEDVAFDAAYFDCFAEVKEGDTVRVKKQAVVRKTGDGELVIVRGVAEPVGATMP